MGVDYIIIDECNMADPSLLKIPKIHLIALKFKQPTVEKVNFILNTFKFTNRFVIEDNIRFYNDILKKTNKKYYVSNVEGDNLITFMRRNNKCLLNVNRLSPLEKAFVLSVSLEDILSNLEVIIVPEKCYKSNPSLYNLWSGNLILSGGENV